MRNASRTTRFLAVVSAALLAGPAAHGQTYTWIGTQTGNWSAAANWSGGTVPVSGATTDLVFNAILDVPYVATNDIASPFIARTITINNSTSNNSPFGVNLVGPLQSQGMNAGIIDNGPGDLYIGPLGTGQGSPSTWNLASDTTISGTNSGQIRINDQITGTGMLTINRPSTNYANNFVFFNLFNTSAPANTFSGGVTLQAGDLAFGNVSLSASSASPNIGTGPLTIASVGGGLTGAGEVRASSAATTLLTMPVTINAGATFNQLRGTAILFAQPVTGGGGVSTGSAVNAPTAGLIFEGASTYTGPTAAINTSITVRGTSGALTGTSQVEMFRNSTLVLDSNTINPDGGNAAGNQSFQDRIPDATPLIFHNAAFNMVGNATTPTTETVGTLTGDGWNTINLTPQTAAGVTLTVSNLVRSNRGTFDVRGANLGGAASGTGATAGTVLTLLNGTAPSASLVGGGGAVGTANISIIPFMTGGLTAGTVGNTFLTYDVNGLRALNTTTEFAAAPAPGSTNNVRMTVPLVAGGQPAVANSLVVGTANAGLWGFGGLTGQVTVNSGAVLASAAGFLNVGTLNFAGQEAVLTGNATTNVNSALVNANGLTYSGTGRTGLLSPNSVISGPITVNSGTLNINTQAQLGGAPAVNLNGGNLAVSNLATGVADTLTTPITVGPAGGSISALPVGGSTGGTAQTLTLTGPLAGSGPLFVNGAGALSNGFVPQTGGGTIVLAGDATNFSGMVVANAGTVQIDSDARLGTNPLLVLSSGANLSQPGTLRVTATTATNKNIYVGGLGFIQVDAGATYTVNGYVSSLTSGSFKKFGAGNLVLTNQETMTSQTFVGSPAMTGNLNIGSGTGAAAAGTFSGVGGTLTLRDQGALLDTIGTTVSAGGTLVLDNTGSANLSNRLSNYGVTLAGGSLVLKGSPTAASTEITGAATLSANTGSVVEIQPGATQTAALFFSGPTVANTTTSGGLVRANTAGGSTLTLRAPGLGGTAAGTGQINFIHNVAAPTGPTLVGGGAPGTPQTSILPGVFGEDSATGAIGLTTLDVVPANPATGFPQYYRSRLLNPGTEYATGSPTGGPATANFRLTAPTTVAAIATANALFVDAGGSLAITSTNTLTLTSGTVVMAGGTNITGGALAAPQDVDLTMYVGAGTATLGSDVYTSTAGPAVGRTLAKAGPGTLTLTTALGGTIGSPPNTLAVQRGTLQLGAGGSLPNTINVSVDAGAAVDLNGPGTTVPIGRLVGLGSVQLGSNPATVLQVNIPSGTSVFGGTISGAGSIEKTGPGTFEFGPTANYTGPITYTAGFLQFGDGSSFTPAIPVIAGGTITMADGTDLSVAGVQDFQRPIAVNVGATTGQAILDTFSGFGNTRFSGPITVGANKTLRINGGSSGLLRFSGAISGNGALAIGASSSGVILDGINSYSGGTTVVAAATIGVGSDLAFGTGPVTTTAALTLFASGASHTIANAMNLNADLTFGTSLPVYQGFDLTLSGPATINDNRTITTLAAGRLTLTSVAESTAGLTLTKAGGGTLALAGANTYTGTTAVNAGTLLVNGTLAGGGGAVTVASGAFLGGTGTVNRTVTLNAGGTVAANGGTFTIGSLTGTGTVNNNGQAPGTIAIGSDNTSTQFDGTVVDGWTGPLTLTKIGSGTLTLTANNTYSGGTVINSGTVSVANDVSLGGGPVNAAPFGTLLYTATTATSRMFPLTGGTVTAATGAVVTFNGSQVSGGFLSGPGTFATGAVGSQFANMTIRPSATLNSNSPADQFFNVANGGALNIAPGLASPVTFIGVTNQGSGSITVGAGSRVNVTDFQTYGTVTLTPGPSTSSPTQLTNTGTTAMYFNGGSRTFVSDVAHINGPAYVDLHGQDAVVAGGLFVNNGAVFDSLASPAGHHNLIADYGATIKGAGAFQFTPVTQNGGKFSPGNSPGAASFGEFKVGQGGVSSYVFQIDDATGTAGPNPDAQGHVNGWDLARAVPQIGPVPTSGNFVWAADSAHPLTLAIDTLVNPTSVGTDVAGPMAHFDPSLAYSWTAVEWTGNYSGPTSVAVLDASTAFDTSGIVNPFSGSIGWDFGPDGHSLNLTYTPVPEPGALILVGAAGLGLGLIGRRKVRRWSPQDSRSDVEEKQHV
jgi:autotransporter-associated beta strand protein